MARNVEFFEDKLVLNLTGITAAAALKKEVVVPYASMRSASVEDFRISLLQFRIGTSIADIRHGRFLIGDKWCFISYNDHKDVVVLELEGHEFGKVVFQTEDPEGVRDDILAKMPR